MNPVSHSLYIVHKLNLAPWIVLIERLFTLALEISGALPAHYSASDG